MSHDSSVDRFVQNLTRRDAQMRVPPQPTVTMRQAVITDVDTVHTTCSLKLSGGTKELPDITYLPHYTPTIGDTCWVLINGNDPLVFGQHISS